MGRGSNHAGQTAYIEYNLRFKMSLFFPTWQYSYISMLTYSPWTPKHHFKGFEGQYCALHRYLKNAWAEFDNLWLKMSSPGDPFHMLDVTFFILDPKTPFKGILGIKIAFSTDISWMPEETLIICGLNCALDFLVDSFWYISYYLFHIRPGVLLNQRIIRLVYSGSWCIAVKHGKWRHDM